MIEKIIDLAFIGFLEFLGMSLLFFFVISISFRTTAYILSQFFKMITVLFRGWENNKKDNSKEENIL